MAPGILRTLTRFCDVITLLLIAASSVMLAAIVLIGGIELVARNLFNKSFVWGHEISLLLANWVYFLGICVVYRHRGDVSVRFFFNALPPRLRRIWSVCCHVLSAAFFALIAFYGWRLIQLQLPFHTTGLGVPNALFSVPVVLSSVILIVLVMQQALADLVGEPDSGRASVEMI